MLGTLFLFNKEKVEEARVAFANEMKIKDIQMEKLTEELKRARIVTKIED